MVFDFGYDDGVQTILNWFLEDYTNSVDVTLRLDRSAQKVLLNMISVTFPQFTKAFLEKLWGWLRHRPLAFSSPSLAFGLALCLTWHPWLSLAIRMKCVRKHVEKHGVKIAMFGGLSCLMNHPTIDSSLELKRNFHEPESAIIKVSG